MVQLQHLLSATRPRVARRLTGLVAALCVALCATCSSDVGEVTDEFVVTNHAADWRGEFIYQIIVDRFANGDLNNDVRVVPGALGRYQGGDWQGVIDNVDYLVELGVTAVWISPIVRNVETDAGYDSYHGYWTQDFLDINPHFGDIATLREMVRVLHDNGILVILDIVANHVGQVFYYDINGNGQPDEFVGGSGVRSPLERTSEYDPDFDIRGVQAVTGLGESGDARIRFFDVPEINRVAPEPAVFANPEWYSRRGRVTAWGREAETCRRDLGIDPDTDWETCFAYVREQEITGDFPGGLKDLRTDLPEVREALIDVMTYWIDYIDIDGFRIDTVKHVEHDFWEQFGTAVREYAHSVGKENFFMFGEAFDGNDWLIGSYTAPGMLDSVFYFSQKFRVYDALFMHGRATADAAALWADRQVNFNTEPQPLGIVDADGNGVPPTQLLVNFIDNHDVSRFLYDQPDIARLHAALGLLFTQDGIPCVYYGTEQGFSGGDDPANREPLWESGYDRQHPTYRWISSLARMRRSYPELMFGTQHVTWATNHIADEQDAGILAFERRYRGARAVIVHNTSFGNTSRTSTSEEGGQHMAVSFAPGTELADVMPGGDFEVFTVTATGCDLEGTCRQPVADDAVDARCGCLDVSLPPSSGRVLVETGRVLREDR